MKVRPDAAAALMAGGDVMLIEPAKREYRTWVVDSRRWQHYRPRHNDIVISTYPKCGTTWMQQIVSMLVFQSPEPRPIMKLSPWIERRMVPIETVLAQMEEQTHRRFLKTHLPLDGLPFYDEVKYIHVARDGRDACMSLHNQVMGFTDQILVAYDAAGLEDETIGRPYPIPLADPTQHFHRWITEGAVPGHEDGTPAMSFFHFAHAWWQARHYPNVLLVHYNDLKSDLPAEMQRISDFLGIPVTPDLWPQLIQAAGFEAMRRDGDVLLGDMAKIFKGGSRGFFFRGSNERWRGKASDEDLALYDAKLDTMLSPDCARWITQGRMRTRSPEEKIN